MSEIFIADFYSQVIGLILTILYHGFRDLKRESRKILQFKSKCYERRSNQNGWKSSGE